MANAIDFVLTGLNQTFTLGVSGEIAAAAPPALDVSCVAVYQIKTSDMLNVFKFQTDSFDVNNVDASDIKYYVYMNAWPGDLSLNPANAHTLSTAPILSSMTLFVIWPFVSSTPLMVSICSATSLSSCPTLSPRVLLPPPTSSLLSRLSTKLLLPMERSLTSILRTTLLALATSLVSCCSNLPTQQLVVLVLQASLTLQVFSRFPFSTTTQSASRLASMPLPTSTPSLIDPTLSRLVPTGLSWF